MCKRLLGSGLIFSVVILLCTPKLFAKNIKLHGYVTSVTSATKFEIDEFKITREMTLALDLQKTEDGQTVAFNPEDIRVGTELEIKGELNEQTSELQATSIKVFPDEHKNIKRTALMERTPALHKDGEGWSGVFFADGQRIQVQPTTQVIFKPNKSEKKALKLQAKNQHQSASANDLKPADESSENDPYAHSIQSIDEIRPNTFMTYQGIRQDDGTIAASRLEFVKNELEDGEAKYWQSIKAETKQPDFAQFKPGELKISKIGKYKLVPSREAQEYVEALGQRLVSNYQKSLPNEDPNRIPFQFFLIENKDPNAFATANGIVVVHSSMLNILENEAQLAAVMSHEIAHSIQEHSWRQHEYHKKALMALRIGGIVGAGFGGRAVADLTNMIEGAIRNGYSRSLENQADRLSLEYMLQSGYDIREAPRVWKVISLKYGDKPTDFFWSSHDSNTVRRSYLMAELRNNYSSLDYTNLKRTSDEYDRVAQLVRDATAKKRSLKVKY